MKLRAKATLALAACCAGVAPAYADVSFHGFGQIVVGSTLGNTHGTFPSEEYTADPSFRPESLFALQVQAPLADKLSATAQIVANGAQGSDFTPKFEWAYMTYQMTDSWAFKAGRQRLPLYKYSDYLEVGQAYNWIRPPLAVYQTFISNIDGLSATGYYELGDWTLQPQIIYGSIDKAFTTAGTSYNFHFSNSTGANVEVGYSDWLSFRIGGSFGKATVNISGLDDLISAIGNSCQIVGVIPTTTIPTCTTDPTAPGGDAIPVNNSALQAGLQANSDTNTFYGVGLDIHKYNFILISELVGFRFNDSLLLRQNAYYVSLGYKWNKLTPMLTFGHSDEATSNPGVAGLVNNGAGLSGVPLSSVSGYSVAIPTSNVVNYLVSTQRALQDYYEVGLRYDTSKNTAIKFDFTRSLNHSPAYADLQGGTVTPAQGVNLLSAAFVFVF